MYYEVNHDSSGVIRESYRVSLSVLQGGEKLHTDEVAHITHTLRSRYMEVTVTVDQSTHSLVIDARGPIMTDGGTKNLKQVLSELILEVAEFRTTKAIGGVTLKDYEARTARYRYKRSIEKLSADIENRGA